jgi:hypothetical protein
VLRQWRPIAIVLLCPMMIAPVLFGYPGHPHASTMAMAAVASGIVCVALIASFSAGPPRPEGYIGKFRRLDGSLAHVFRLPSGKLWAASDEKPGVRPVDLGYISGRDLAVWTKLSSEADAAPHVVPSLKSQ